MNKKGEPVFTCTEDAFLYGRLVVYHPEKIEQLKQIRKRTMKEFYRKLSGQNPAYGVLMQTAMKGQFAREALEEVERMSRFND